MFQTEWINLNLPVFRLYKAKVAVYIVSRVINANANTQTDLPVSFQGFLTEINQMPSYPSEQLMLVSQVIKHY